MNILIFIIVLAVLILVHEFGHFITAKKSGVRVDEFGIGFPPKLLTLFTWKATKFTLNAIPFGGFVKIFGENPVDQPTTKEEEKTHFTHKSKSVQALILSAGILFNIIFAWILISIGFMYGLPSPQAPGAPEIENTRLVVTSVLPESPAAYAGIKTGDVIKAVKSDQESLDKIDSDTVSKFISENSQVLLTLSRGEETLELEILPKEGIVADKKAIGISMGMIGTLKLPVHLAILEAFKMTTTLVWAVAVGLVTLLGKVIVGQGDFSGVAGPVGIVGLVGDATQLGFIYLLQFTAFISINLAVINLVPFPALDGGRLLFLLIEKIKGSAINPKVANSLNTVGFVLLIILMIVITINDFRRIF